MEIRQIVKSPETCERCRYSDELCDVRSCSSCPQHIAAPTVDAVEIRAKVRELGTDEPTEGVK